MLVVIEVIKSSDHLPKEKTQGFETIQTIGNIHVWLVLRDDHLVVSDCLNQRRVEYISPRVPTAMMRIFMVGTYNVLSSFG